MSYRCAICRAIVPRGQPRKIHVVYRPVRVVGSDLLRKEIDRELPVCSTCDESLTAGMPLGELYRHHRPTAPDTPVVAEKKAPPTVFVELPPVKGTISADGPSTQNLRKPVVVPAAKATSPQAILDAIRSRQSGRLDVAPQQPTKKNGTTPVRNPNNTKGK